MHICRGEGATKAVEKSMALTRYKLVPGSRSRPGKAAQKRVAKKKNVGRKAGPGKKVRERRGRRRGWRAATNLGGKLLTGCSRPQETKGSWSSQKKNPLGNEGRGEIGKTRYKRRKKTKDWKRITWSTRR